MKRFDFDFEEFFEKAMYVMLLFMILILMLMMCGSLVLLAIRLFF